MKTIKQTKKAGYLILFIVILSALFEKQLKSQTLVDTNKVWSVIECNIFGGCQTYFYKFKEDTILGAYHYRKLYYTNDSTMFYWHYISAMREDTAHKKVFCWSEQNEYLYYDFGLNKNDTFKSNALYVLCTQLIVDSIGETTLLNKEKRKTFFLSGNGFGKDIWIEGIGSMSGLTNVRDAICSFDFYSALNCFTENDILKYKSSQYSTCYYTTVGIPKINVEGFLNIFPNPFQNILYINSNKLISQIEIFSSEGKIIYSNKIFNLKNSDRYTLNLSNLSPGLYLIKITNSKNQIDYEKIVKNY